MNHNVHNLWLVTVTEMQEGLNTTVTPSGQSGYFNSNVCNLVEAKRKKRLNGYTG